jgi:tyrosine-protein phosphatase SIW14
MPGTKVPISEILMASVMEVVLNKENYPILVHCNHGKHRTGCAMAVVRHVTGWEVDAIVDEYRGYAEPKVRECDIQYIMNYQVSSLQGLFVKKRIRHKRPVLSNWKMARILMVTVIVLAIWLTTLLYW